MKKIFSFLAAAIFALGFYSCEDVPAPYEINDEGDAVPEAGDALIDESFASSLGQFSAVNVKGDYSWKVDYSCAQITSYTDDDGDGVKMSSGICEELIKNAYKYGPKTGRPDGWDENAELPEVWKTYFYDNIPEADGYFEKAHMDFSVILPISDKADEGLWKQSKLEKVKEYILKQFEGIEK